MPVFNPITSHYTTRLFSAIGKKLYLNPELADVHFIFESNGETEIVAAHKILLKAVSDVFATMLNGKWKEKDVVAIVDVSAAAFKEFLQFFYFGQVELTMENVAAVMNLSEMYNVTECLAVCSKFLKNNLNDDNVCRYYGLALLYNQEDLKQSCETVIGVNANAVFNTSGFLACNKQLLAEILKLDWLSCTEAELFEACMAWVNASSRTDVLSKKLIQARLGDLFYDFRFGSMSLQEFAALTPTYGHLFGKDYQIIIQMIADNQFQANKFNENREKRCDSDLWSEKDKIRCYRLLSTHDSVKPYFIKEVETTKFSVDQPLLLISFTIGQIAVYRHDEYIDSENVPTKVSIFKTIDSNTTTNYDESDSDTEMDVSDDSDSSDSDSDESDTDTDTEMDVSEDSNEEELFTVKSKLKHSRSNNIVLSQPILIQPGSVYKIRLEQKPPRKCAIGKLLKTVVRMNGGITIQFHDDPLKPGDFSSTGLIENLIFCSIAE